MDGCLVSVLTPVGRGAVATVLVVGGDAASLVAQRLRTVGQPLDAVPLGRIVFGRWSVEEPQDVAETGAVRWGEAAPVGEEVVVARRSAREVEVHCHGGLAAVRAVVEALVGLGCHEVPWQDLLNPGLVSTRPGEAITAEAIAALAAARTERTAAILLDQYRGALGNLLQQAAADVVDGAVAAAREALRRLERRADLGLHLTSPWRVVLAGRANVGKSSLVNALLGYQRAIVCDQPGTTRDVVTAHTALDGWPVELADTAGLRESSEAIEAAGIAQARCRVERADLVVLIFDGTQVWQAEDESLLQTWPQALVVHSKSDRRQTVETGRPPGLRTSAVTGEGLPELVQRLVVRLVPAAPPPGTPVPFTRRQTEGIRAAREALEAGNGQSAVRWLNGVLGSELDRDNAQLARHEST